MAEYVFLRPQQVTVPAVGPTYCFPYGTSLSRRVSTASNLAIWFVPVHRRKWYRLSRVTAQSARLRVCPILHIHVC
jgi:hypothetical protein